jgi:AcrR family transcriptional regulator
MAENDTRVANDQESADLTARARIRDAAMREFAAHGFRGASIRGIAKVAGVSPGLIQHHFGTKEGLRKSCDNYVMEFMRRAQDQFTSRGAPSPEMMLDRLGDLQPVLEYLIMSLSSGSDAANQWFDEITEYTYETLISGRIGPALDPGIETRTIAATQAAMALGITAFYRSIQRAIGVEDETEFMVRVGRARAFLAPERIVDAETRERLERALDQYEHARSTRKPSPENEV